MKGAIGSATILNIVITFIIIFLSLLVGSMAYSKAYKTKNFIINKIEQYEDNGISIDSKKNTEFVNEVNEYMAKTGYTILTQEIGCKNRESDDFINIVNKRKKGEYDYCIYEKNEGASSEQNIKNRHYYLVETYMRLDLPVIGKILKIPVRGTTKTFVEFK